jgi:hypothetical protein
MIQLDGSSETAELHGRQGFQARALQQYVGTNRPGLVSTESVHVVFLVWLTSGWHERNKLEKFSNGHGSASLTFFFSVGCCYVGDDADGLIAERCVPRRGTSA